MVFTWDWRNTCVVFKWWHVQTPFGLVATLAAITLLSMGYEYSRALILRRTRAPRVRAALYALQVFYSFFLMLVFMTYNGLYMLAVVAGAGIGNLLWGTEPERTLVCH